MKAKKDDFELARVSVICRKGMAEQANKAMLDASNSLSVYGMEITERPITDKEWRELVLMTPPDILEEGDSE